MGMQSITRQADASKPAAKSPDMLTVKCTMLVTQFPKIGLKPI
jgi:hypothetical protein